MSIAELWPGLTYGLIKLGSHFDAEPEMGLGVRSGELVLMQSGEARRM